MVLISSSSARPSSFDALQPDVEEDQPRHAVGDRRQRAVAVMRGARFVPFVAENAGDEFANVLFVVDDQNVRRHH